MKKDIAMTPEQKAKAYDEAMNKIKPLYEQAKRDGNPIWSTYEYLIPELREEEKPLTPFQQCLNLILHKVYFASVPGKIEDVDKFILDTVKKHTDELVGLAKKHECTDCQLHESENEKMMQEFNDWLCEEIECRTSSLCDEKDRRTLNMLCYVLTKVKEWLGKQKESLHVSKSCKENADSFTDIKDRNIRGCIGMALADVSESRFKTYGVTLKECLAWLERKKGPDYPKRNTLFDKCVENCGPEVMKAIEDVIRVYDKTQGEWIAGYDMDTLVVHLRKAFAALEKQQKQKLTTDSRGYSFLSNIPSETMEQIKPVKRTEEDEKARKELIFFLNSEIPQCSIQEHAEKLKQFVTYLEKQQEQKPNENMIPCDGKCGECPCFNAGRKYEQKEHVPKNEETGTQEQKPVQSTEEKEFIRTIKSIIADFIRDKKPEDVGFYQQIYDWLDGRHIEQKPVESWPNLSNCIHNCKKCFGRCIYRKEANPEMSQSKPVELSRELSTNDSSNPSGLVAKNLTPEQMREKTLKPVEYGDDIVEDAEEYTSKVDCGEYGVEVTEAYIAGALRERSKKPVEWSEEEKQLLDSIIDDYEKAAKSFCGYDGKIILLKAIRDGECDLPKRKWSDEDEKMINDIIYCLPKMAMGNIEMLPSVAENYAERLKSLRPTKDCDGCPKHLEGYISGRSDAENKLLEMYGILLMPDGELRMKPQWKPSKEQLDALEECGECKRCIKKLYEQLKKL